MTQIIHKYEVRNEIAQIVIYAYSPVEFEFAEDIDEIEKNATNTADDIREYVRKNLSNIPNAVTTLILNGVTLGTSTISNVINSKK